MLVRAVFKILAPLISSQEEQSEPDSLTFRLLFTPEFRRKEVAGWLQEEASRAGWSDGQLSMKAQAGGDLGNRLRVAFEQGFEEGYEQVAAIGTDCVEFDCATIRQSFDQLSGDFDLVFGPAADGGYYLVGMKQPETCKVFDGIPWSSDTTLAASLKVAAGDGYRVHLLKELSDVDTAADWQRVRAHV